MTAVTIHEFTYGDNGVRSMTSPARLSVFTLPGGEPHTRFDEQDRRGTAALGHVISVTAPNAETFMQALAAKSAIDVMLPGSKVGLVIPYLPGARQDRRQCGAPFTAKMYADLINQAGFGIVVGLDPHSEVMPALIDRFVSLPAEMAAPKLPDGFVEPSTVVIAPDAGAVKRAEAFAAALGVPVIYARKTRDPQTGQLQITGSDPIPEGCSGLIVDDICDGGGTFLGLADLLDVERERLGLWVTHGIFSKGTGELGERFGRIGCTDSYTQPGQFDQVDVVPVIDRLVALAAARLARPW